MIAGTSSPHCRCLMMIMIAGPAAEQRLCPSPAASNAKSESNVKLWHTAAAVGLGLQYRSRPAGLAQRVMTIGLLGRPAPQTAASRDQETWKTAFSDRFGFFGPRTTVQENKELRLISIDPPIAFLFSASTRHAVKIKKQSSFAVGLLVPFCPRFAIR
jgi:hypothetical protein